MHVQVMDFDDDYLVDFDSDASSLEEADVRARGAAASANDDSHEGSDGGGGGGDGGGGAQEEGEQEEQKMEQKQEEEEEGEEGGQEEGLEEGQEQQQRQQQQRQQGGGGQEGADRVDIWVYGSRYSKHCLLWAFGCVTQLRCPKHCVLLTVCIHVQDCTPIPCGTPHLDAACLHLHKLFALQKLACIWPVGMGACRMAGALGSWMQGPGKGLHRCIVGVQAGGCTGALHGCRPGGCTGALWVCRPGACTGAPCHGQALHRCIAGRRPAPVHK